MVSLTPLVNHVGVSLVSIRNVIGLWKVVKRGGARVLRPLLVHVAPQSGRVLSVENVTGAGAPVKESAPREPTLWVIRSLEGPNLLGELLKVPSRGVVQYDDARAGHPDKA